MSASEEPIAPPPVDPEWVAEQRRKNDAASEKYADWRREIGLPLVRKKPGERV